MPGRKNAGLNNENGNFMGIDKICDIMGLPDTLEKLAIEYYNEAMVKSSVIKSMSVHSTWAQSVVAALVFLACRQSKGYCRTFKEISHYVPSAKTKTVGRVYKLIVEQLKLKENQAFRDDAAVNHPENFIPRFMAALGFSDADIVSAVALSNVMVPQGSEAAKICGVWDGKLPTVSRGHYNFYGRIVNGLKTTFTRAYRCSVRCI